MACDGWARTPGPASLSSGYYVCHASSPREALVCALVTSWEATTRVVEGSRDLTARVVEDRVPELPALGRQGTSSLA